ncbi:MAG: Gfo/Idh/MocA family oxidoreductase [Clostridia bacterium]
MKKIRWALIGYGGMGGWHVGKVQTMQEFEIAGIWDIDSARQEAAKKAGLHAYESMDALLNDPSVQLVTIAIPNDQHRPVACACMRAGKNVICEKPVALSSAEVQEMIDVSRQTGMLFTVHQNRRWDEDYLIVQQLLQEKRLGSVFRIESRVHGSRGIPGDWRNTKRQGGGMILDWGVHLLDQILQLTQEPIVAVHCEIQHVTNDEVDDGFLCQLTFASGLVAHVEVGTSHFIALPRWCVWGENGSAQVDNFHCDGKLVMVSDWEKRDAVPVVTAAGLTKTMAPRSEETIQTYPLPKVSSDVRDFYRNVGEALEGNAKQLVTHKQILRCMRLMEALLLSAEENVVVHTRL